MHVTLAGVVLALHISVVIAAFFVASMVHLAFHFMPRAVTIRELRPWAALLRRTEPLLPGLALLILGFGAWLVHLEHDEGISWSAGWIVTALVTLVGVEALAGTQLAPRVKSLVHRIELQPNHAKVPPDISRDLLDPVVWGVGHAATFGFLGIVFVMAAKPPGSWAWALPVAGIALGQLLAQLQLRTLRTLAAEYAVPPVSSDALEVPVPAREPAAAH